MKKIILTIAGLLTFGLMNSCLEDVLDLKPPYDKPLSDAIKTEEDVQLFLNGAYMKISTTALYGSHVVVFGDLIGDSFFRSNSSAGTFNSLAYMNYSPSNLDDIDFYRSAYDVIQNANFVIYNELEETPLNKQYKAEASVLRALTYFTLLNYYASSPASNQYQEYGVPIAAYPYNSDVKLSRSSVSEVYDLIIRDLNYAIENGIETPSSKVRISNSAARILLSRVYLTRQASGDAQKALELSQAVQATANTSGSVFRRITAKNEYVSYFSGNRDALTENMPETIWELDINSMNTPGVNYSLGTYYSGLSPKPSILAKTSFYESIPTSDIRKGLFSTTRVPTNNNPLGAWITKHNHINIGGNYLRNVKIFRVSEAYLNEVEALYQLNRNAEALTKLNEFATVRQGSTYSGTNLLKDILDERNKEFFGEGQRFLDLKRYNLPINNITNCSDDCVIPANDKLFVFPMTLTGLILNPNAVQHPLWQ